MIDLSGAADLARLANGSWVFSGFNNSELAKLQEQALEIRMPEHSASLLSDSSGNPQGFTLKAIVSVNAFDVAASGSSNSVEVVISQ